VVVLARVAYGAVDEDGSVDGLGAAALGIAWLVGSIIAGAAVPRAWAAVLPPAAVLGFIAVGPASPGTYDNELWVFNLLLVLVLSVMAIAVGVGAAHVFTRRGAS
jgi:hypothetical protein